MKGPLNGIRVLTVESFIAGPMASMWLADAGAEVVKIEAPAGGDTARNVPPLKGQGSGSQSLSFIRANRNKRSVALDLKSEEGGRPSLRSCAKPTCSWRMPTQLRFRGLASPTPSSASTTRD